MATKRNTTQVSRKNVGRRPLQSSDHKYSRGVIAVIAGSRKYPGAGVLTVGGARRGGAGYVKYLNHNQQATALVLHQFPDVVPIDNLLNQRVDALVVGPGETSLRKLPANIPVVLDSGAFSLLGERKISRDPNQIIVVTPHEGELPKLGFRLEHQSVSSVLRQKQRVETAQKIADQLNVIVVLKGPRTIIAAPHSKPIIDTLGGPELAVAGSGDIVAGLIGAFLASWRPGNFHEAQNTVAGAVHLHSQAGKHAAKNHSVVVATDILESLAHC